MPSYLIKAFVTLEQLFTIDAPSKELAIENFDKEAYPIGDSEEVNVEIVTIEEVRE